MIDKVISETIFLYKTSGQLRTNEQQKGKHGHKRAGSFPNSAILRQTGING